MEINFSNLSPSQMRKAAVLKERIETIQRELNALVGATPAQSSNGRVAKFKKTGGNRIMSDEVKRKIAEGQRARWAARKAQAA